MPLVQILDPSVAVHRSSLAWVHDSRHDCHKRSMSLEGGVWGRTQRSNQIACHTLKVRAKRNLILYYKRNRESFFCLDIMVTAVPGRSLEIASLSFGWYMTKVASSDSLDIRFSR